MTRELLTVDRIAEIRCGELTLAHAVRLTGQTKGAIAKRVWKATKDDVVARDRWCVYCGAADALDVHHRIARGAGGTSNPAIAYAMSNLITLCRQHHDYVEGEKAWALRHGYKVPRCLKPSIARVWRFGSWEVLHDDGDVTPWAGAA